MTTYRVSKDRDNPYVMLNKTCLDDEALSLKAKGLHAYLMSKPDDWKVRLGQLIKAHRDGKDSINSALSELQESGYIVRHQQERGNNGQMKSSTMDVFETPNRSGLTAAEKPPTEKPVAENPPLLINDLVNNKQLRNDTTNTPAAQDEPAKTGAHLLVAAFHECRKKYKEKNVLTKGEIAGGCKNLFKSGVTADVVRETYDTLRNDSWWSDKKITPVTIGREIGRGRRSKPKDTSSREAWGEVNRELTPAELEWQSNLLLELDG